MNDPMQRNDYRMTEARSFDGRAGEYGVPVTAALDRGTFVVKTYLHLLGAILLFVAIEVALFQSGLAERIATSMMGVSWLVVLGGFLLVSWFASRVAGMSASLPLQYLALAGFVCA